jgi:hypothetical protein
MRSILLAAVLAASLVTHVQIADACGAVEWEPTAHLIATPMIAPEKAVSFALLYDQLDAKRAKRLTFTRLDRMSFDSTKTAPGHRLHDAVQLTLLGPSGTKLVTIRDTTWVDLAFDHEEAREAVQLPAGEFIIALDGHYKDAAWQSFEVIHGDTVTVFHGTNVQAIVQGGASSFTINGTSMDGYPLGIVTVNGVRYVAARSATSRNEAFLAKF